MVNSQILQLKISLQYALKISLRYTFGSDKLSISTVANSLPSLMLVLFEASYKFQGCAAGNPLMLYNGSFSWLSFRK